MRSGAEAFFPGPCASSGGRLPEALFMGFQLDSKGRKACQKRFLWFFNWIPKVQKCANLVDLVKGFQTSIYYLLNFAKFGFDTVESGLLKVCQLLLKRQKKVRKNIGDY